MHVMHCHSFKNSFMILPGDEELVVPHQLTFPMPLKMAEDGVFVDEITFAPVEHIQLTIPTSSRTPDQNRF